MNKFNFIFSVTNAIKNFLGHISNFLCNLEHSILIEILFVIFMFLSFYVYEAWYVFLFFLLIVILKWWNYICSHASMFMYIFFAADIGISVFIAYYLINKYVNLNVQTLVGIKEQINVFWSCYLISCLSFLIIWSFFCLIGDVKIVKFCNLCLSVLSNCLLVIIPFLVRAYSFNMSNWDLFTSSPNIMTTMNSIGYNFTCDSLLSFFAEMFISPIYVTTLVFTIISYLFEKWIKERKYQEELLLKQIQEEKIRVQGEE